MRDLTFKKFGRLIACSVVGRHRNGQRLWNCLCDCGKYVTVASWNLTSGGTRSCGCIRKRGVRIMNLAEHMAWRQAIARCTRRTHHAWELYGGRGIKVCERWLGKQGFVNFLADMGTRPEGRNGKRAAYSLDRIDSNKDYEPSNCRWGTWKQQSESRRERLHNRILPRKVERSIW